MRDLAQAILRELNLDYKITLVSGGESGKYEIVMWDRPHNSYFSVRFNWTEGTPRQLTADLIRRQLQQRLAAHHLVDDRRPVRRWTAA